MEISELESKAKEIRKEIIEMLFKSKSGHPGGSLSAVDLLVGLYHSGHLKVDASNPDDPDRDRFILSKGHCTPVIYSVLADRGFFPKEELNHFRQFGHLLQGHTVMNIPGVEHSGGSLGQGISFAIGVALAARLDKKDYQTYVMLGDGETQEGEVWEAAMAAAHFKLDNLTVIIDKNQIQNDNFVDKTIVVDPLGKKWEAFGFHVKRIDGHNISEILQAYEELAQVKDKPKVLIADTFKGKGVSFMELNPNFHGAAPNEEEYKKAMEELNS